MKASPKKTTQRFWAIDALRGIAVVGMVVFHFFFILDFFDVISQPMRSGWWLILARFVEFIFLGLLGVSLALSQKSNLEQLFRGLKILGLSLIITLVTYIFIPEQFVIFGILHLMGVSIILLAPLRKKPYLALAFGIIVMLLSKSIAAQKTTFMPFYIVGLHPPMNVNPVDYFPIFPWISVVLIGLFAGHFLMKKKPSHQITQPQYSQPLTFLGRRSLLIYLIHIPLIIAILMLTKVIEF